MKKSRPTVFAIALLASAWASPVAAELAPRLVEYIAGVGQSPDAGDGPPSSVRAAQPGQRRGSRSGREAPDCCPAGPAGAGCAGGWWRGHRCPGPLYAGARSAAGNIDALIRHFFDDTNRFFVAALAADNGSMDHYVPIFNPASNFDQQSRLRLVNSGDSAASVRIDGRDDACDAPPEGSVSLTLDPGAAHLITARELEQGSEDSSGRFGVGAGKWQLFVSSDQPIQVMSLLLSPTGNLTNLSP